MYHHKSWKHIYYKVKGQGHEAQKQCQPGFLHSCECWLLLVCMAVVVDVATRRGLSGSIGQSPPRFVCVPEWQQPGN